VQDCAQYIESKPHSGFEDDIKEPTEAQKQEYAERRKQIEQDERQEAAQRQQKKLDSFAAYRRNNNDGLAWLGPLPEQWSDKVFEQRASKTFKAIDSDIQRFDPKEIYRFKCKAPAEFGPTPHDKAVAEYYHIADDYSRPWQQREQALENLMVAARSGNWQARQALYFRISGLDRPDPDESPGLAWRWLQLREWLLARKAGGLYYEYIEKLAGTGYFGAHESIDLHPAYILGALHGSYSAMDKAGKALRGNPDQRLGKIGQEMFRCAHAMMPSLFD
jgi:hypothetical protein